MEHTLRGGFVVCYGLNKMPYDRGRSQKSRFGGLRLGRWDEISDGLPEHNGFDHPTIAPSVQYVSETFEREMQIKIKAYNDSPNYDPLILPAMDRHQRRRVHTIVHRYPGLTSSSIGHEPNRKTVVYKRAAMGGTSMYETQKTAETEPIKLDSQMHNTIRSFVVEYPIDQKMVDEYLIPPSKGAQKSRSSHGRGEPMNVPPKASPNSHMQRFKSQLPAYQYRGQVLEAVRTHSVVLVTGGTGCGKTTQVPQFLLDEAADAQLPIKIICTQPRRLPAITIAERVAKERGEPLPDTVGYHIRLEQKTTHRCSLLYCTSGVLLRFLSQDDLITDATHVILDEIHERETNTDYLLIALKQALKKRADLKVILMSATMEGNLRMFMEYFGDDVPVKHISIESRLYPVDRYFLGDIIAMTGYMPPQSSFSSVFSTFDSPHLDAAFETEQHNPYAMQTPYGMEYTAGFNDGYNGMTVARPQEEMSQFELDMYNERKKMQQMRAYVQSSLQNRLPFFEPCLRKMLEEAEVNEKTLSDIYLKAGGLTFKEGIDYDLCLTVLTFLMGSPLPGAILVFLPGYEDLSIMRDKIREYEWPDLQPVTYLLHSQMNTGEQHAVFDHVHGRSRKIILSTNLAEASLTIEDVVFVIDCGKVKEKTYDHESRISQLRTIWIAKSNAEQRAGRAGRCREGYCFRLYSKEDYDVMAECQTAEMRRAAIHDVCLHAKMFAPGKMTVKEFLSMAPEPPEETAVENSMQFLEQLGALYSVASTSDSEILSLLSPEHTFRPEVEPDLTDLGKIVAQLPLDPQLSRMLLFGIALRCLNPVVTIVAAMSNRDPFCIMPNEDRDTVNKLRDSFGRCDFSDHIALLRSFYEYEKEKLPRKQIDFCKKNYLNSSSMKMIAGIRRQLLLELRRVHMIVTLPGQQIESALTDFVYNEYSNSWPMVQAAIIAGSFPNIAWAKTNNKFKKIRTNAPEKHAILHPSSVVKRHVQVQNSQAQGNARVKHLAEMLSGEPTTEYIAYSELARLDNSQLTVRTVTVVPPCAIVLFAGPLRMKQSTFEKFNLVEDSVGSSDEENGEATVEETGLGTHCFSSYCLHEVDNWFIIKSSSYKDMQRLLQLRFHLMSYFLRTLKKPQILRDVSQFGDTMLQTLEAVLAADHKRMGYPLVDKLCQVDDPSPRTACSLSYEKPVNDKTVNNDDNGWNKREKTEHQTEQLDGQRKDKKKFESRTKDIQPKMIWSEGEEEHTHVQQQQRQDKPVTKEMLDNNKWPRRGEPSRVEPQLDTRERSNNRDREAGNRNGRYAEYGDEERHDRKHTSSFVPLRGLKNGGYRNNMQMRVRQYPLKPEPDAYIDDEDDVDDYGYHHSYRQPSHHRHHHIRNSNPVYTGVSNDVRNSQKYNDERTRAWEWDRDAGNDRESDREEQQQQHQHQSQQYGGRQRYGTGPSNSQHSSHTSTNNHHHHHTRSNGKTPFVRNSSYRAGRAYTNSHRK